jgi:hypothetical protein
MEVTGKIIAVLPIQEGTSKAGNPWKKRYYVLETQETYPKKIAFYVFGTDRVAQYENITVGLTVRVNFDIESREWQGRWFTDIQGWKIDLVEDANAASAPQAHVNPAATQGSVPPPPAVSFTSAEPTDDLPF